MPTTSPERARILRRRHLHERQAVVFGSLVAVLAVVGLGSAAVYTGVVQAPFLSPEFVTPPPEDDGPDLAPAPCPPEGTLPAAYNTVQVSVLNGSGRTGLASQTAAGLTARGFVVGSTGNYPASLGEPARVLFGEAGLASAYAVAAQVDGAVLVLDTRADATVDLVIGATFVALLDPASIVIDPATPLVGVAGCVSLEDARLTAQPGPVAETTEAPPATEGELPDGGEGFDDEAPAEG